MATSTSLLFKNIIDSYFPKLQTVIDKINGKRGDQQTYLFKERLRTEYSADQRWESASVNTNYVMADMVAMDSPLPLKARPTLSVASGKLPKIGIMKQMGESQINTLNIMAAQSTNSANVVKKLVADDEACNRGIDEKNEFNFLTALSTGLVAVTEDDGGNTALRIDFGYLNDNKFGVTTAGTLTIDDIRTTVEAADANGVALAEMWISKSAYDALRATDGAKELVATFNGQTYTSATKLPVPNSTRFQEAFADEFGISIVIVNRSVLQERNGVRTSVKPWDDNKVVFTVGGEIGALVYGTLAEQTNPVQDVAYSTVDGYKLISKFSEANPLRSYTLGQALCLPVIENVDLIYQIDIATAKA